MAISPDQQTRRQIALLWGVQPLKVKRMRNVDEMVNFAERRLLEEGLVRRGDLIGIVAGTPVGVGGTTNFIRFHVVGGGLQWRR